MNNNLENDKKTAKANSGTCSAGKTLLYDSSVVSNTWSVDRTVHSGISHTRAGTTENPITIGVGGKKGANATVQLKKTQSYMLDGKVQIVQTSTFNDLPAECCKCVGRPGDLFFSKSGCESISITKVVSSTYKFKWESGTLNTGGSDYSLIGGSVLGFEVSQ
jgi:hypothetical protein